MDKYFFQNGQFTIEDSDLALSFQENTPYILLPTHPKNGQPLSDNCITRTIFNNNGILHEAFPEKDGYANGQWLLYYPSGSIKMESFYRNGRLHGPSTYFDTTGKEMGKSWFVNGERQGKLNWFYENGQLYSLQRFVNNLWHGKQEYYYPNGKLKTLVVYEHGVLKEKPILNWFSE